MTSPYNGTSIQRVSLVSSTAMSYCVLREFISMVFYLSQPETTVEFALKKKTLSKRYR